MDDGTDSIKIWHMKRSASGQAQKRYRELINKSPMDYQTMFMLMENFWVDQDKIHAMAKALLKKENDGEELTQDMIMSFKIESTAQWAKKQAMLDSTSRLLIAGSGDANDYQSFQQKFPECIVSNFRLHGTYGCIYGPPRSGKTDFACTLMTLMMGFNLEVITNIKMKMHQEGIHVISTLSDLVKKLIDNKKQTVVILDETATVVSKQKATSTRTIDFQNLARFIGKMKSSLIMVTQSYSRDVPSLIQDWTTEKYEKLNLKMCKVDLTRNGGHIKLHRIFRDIPKTNMPFETYDITGLQFDISIDDLLQTIADSPDKDKAIQMYISSGKQEEEQEQSRDKIVDDTVNIMIKDTYRADKTRGPRGKATRELVGVEFPELTTREAIAVAQKFNMQEETKEDDMFSWMDHSYKWCTINKKNNDTDYELE